MADLRPFPYQQDFFDELSEHALKTLAADINKNGLRNAKHDYILIADADGTYPLEDIPRLLAEADKYAMVVGARTGAVFAKRRWLT